MWTVVLTWLAYPMWGIAVSSVISVVGMPVAELYAKHVYAERCKAMVVLAHGDDWDAIVRHCGDESARTLKEAPRFPWWPPAVFRYARDLRAWWTVRDWAREQRGW